ncbi:MAG: AraC family transcriptional regulator [Oscillospiraceae bacterium]|nr:AraC family transcriptional regulator [Oscillospiraceae bacterium]
MKNEIRTVSGEITRVHVDRKTREAGCVMRGHHYHPYYELAYIEHGSCRFFIEDTMFDLHDGDFLLIPPQVFHFTRYLFGSCLRCGIYFRAGDLESELISYFPDGADFLSQVRIFQVPTDARREIGRIIMRMAAEDRGFDERSPLMLRLQLQELLLLCSRVCLLLTETPASIHTTDRQVLMAARYINEHFRQQISAADIAAAAGFSPNYLSRKFREAAGIGVHDYLVFIRLRSAAFELISTSDSVTDIALRNGFSDSNYFKDVFKKKYGMTPREYRKTR